MGKQLQFELWKECNSKCTFCYLGNTNRFTPEETKLYNLEKALSTIKNLEIYNEYDTIAFIGGEFFQGQLNTEAVKNKFFELMQTTADLMKAGYVKTTWLYATLTIGEQTDLYTTLDIFKDYQDNFWLLTSYDTMGRFHTKKMKDNWSYHMLNIRKLYPGIKFNTTTIITGDLIDKYLADEFSFKNLMSTYNTSMFVKLCAGPEGMYISKEHTNQVLGNFFPKRDAFLRFLKKVKREEGLAFYDKLFNIQYRADTLICEYEEHDAVVNRNKENGTETYNPRIDYIMDCGHLSVYSAYIDSNRCAICDKQMIRDLDI